MGKSLLNRAEKLWIKGRQSPLKVVLASLLCALLLVVFCGGNAWIPVSRLNNITLKNTLMPFAQAAAFPGQALGVDEYVPKLRLLFVTCAGLSDNPNWDTRFFNQRSSLQPPSESTVKNVLSDVALKTEQTTETGEKTGQANQTENSAKAYSAEEPFKVYIFGDSQITSLGIGFDRLTKNIDAVVAEHVGIISSGFIRDEYYAWGAKIADITQKNDFDAAVFMLGMNDNIDVLDSEGASIYRKTPEWNDYYTKRCNELLDQITRSFSKVYWLGMPMSKSKKYDENLRYIDSIHEKIASEYDSNILIRVSIRDIFPGKNKEYRDTNYFPDGKVIRMMGDDGNHFTISGGQWIMNEIYNHIISDFSFKPPLGAVVLPE
ncbi:MAG TPA: DUF459 domain-containing protein [Treponemataceae bacterium]|nr:DUF459 domain-containing protein [Treponemataceae bacterium]